MADITIIRLEIENIEASDKKGSESDLSAGNLLEKSTNVKLEGNSSFVTGGVGQLKGFKQFEKELKKYGYEPDDFPDVKVGGLITGVKQRKKSKTRMTQANSTRMFTNAVDKGKTLYNDSYSALHTEASLRSIEIGKKRIRKYGPLALGTAGAITAGVFQYQATGHQLSGASHQANKEQRKATMALFSTGIGVSLATGQYWATAIMLAGRAWQVSQENRKTIYSITASQRIASVMSERLVQDVAYRRF